jgi:hypothetical protein
MPFADSTAKGSSIIQPVRHYPEQGGVHMRRVEFLIVTVFLSVSGVFAWQQHRAGTIGPGTPPLEGQGHWRYLAPLPHARGGVAVAEEGGKIYVLGGYADGFVDQPLNEEYDPVKNSWRGRAPMPRGLNHVGAVGLNGRVYCIGGFVEQNKSPVVDVSVCDPAADPWQNCATAVTAWLGLPGSARR